MATRRVYKYGTGQVLPNGAIYLCSKVQELPPEVQMHQHEIGGPTWLVWHYYEVLTDDAGMPLEDAEVIAVGASARSGALAR